MGGHPAMRHLAKFSISVREEDFVLQLVDETGQAYDFATSPEQLDNVIDALDELLTEDEELGEDDDDAATYQKPLG
jgi:hypothetical protein